MHSFQVKTPRREVFVDVTAQVREALARAGVREGLCLVYSPHTTAGVTINENSDPDVPRDMLAWFRAAVPREGPEGDRFRHDEGNADAHLKASLVGAGQTVPVAEGQLVLGVWQAIFLCEFDGPRTRTVHVQVVGR
jgi:secondary thiamine-phosphate synthase enzyme